MTVEILRKEYADKPTPNWMELSKEVLAAIPERLESVPFQIKKIAVRDAVSALKVGKKKVAQKTISHFALSFRSRKEPRQSCFIPSSALRESGIYPRVAGKIDYREELPPDPADSRLLYLRGRWMLCVPYRKEAIRAETQGRIVALDPGIRTFMAFYAVTPQAEQFGHLGRGDFSRIARLAIWADRLVARIDQARKEKNVRRVNQLRRALDRIKNKIHDLVTELHHKVAHWLVQNYDVILLPTFEVSNMVIKGKRKIRKKSVKSLLSFRHHEFAQHLENKALEHGKLVLRVNEAYTSKTNSFTGVVNYKQGGAAKVRVGAVWIDRDINGARNILLRALVDTPALRALVTCVREHVNVR